MRILFLKISILKNLRSAENVGPGSDKNPVFVVEQKFGPVISATRLDQRFCPTGRQHT
jgi:hypothetical protein